MTAKSFDSVAYGETQLSIGELELGSDHSERFFKFWGRDMF